ncbi:MAG TPA: DUF5687 family protein [Puia sp.]
MILTLLSHQWKSFWRGRNAGRNLATQIFIGFLIAYILASMLVFGLALGHILHKVAPGRDSVQIFCGLILYYFFIDLLLRFAVQELPVLSVQPYLGQNIRRTQMVGFLNIRALFHFLNLLPLLLFLPFACTEMAAHNGVPAAAAFIGAIVFTIIFSNYLILYIKRRIIVNAWWLVGFALVMIVFTVLDILGIISLHEWSSKLLGALLNKPILVLIPMVLGMASFFNNYRYLLTNLYLDEGGKAEKAKTSREYSWLQQLGLTGELIAMEIKLMLRNKRPKALVRLSIVFMLYGFIFYQKSYMADPHMYVLLIPALFVTGVFIMNYGQFLFAWHSSYFDGLMAANISIPDFIRSKFMLYNAVGTTAFIITSLYGLISWKILVLQAAGFLYNIGINSAISIYLATFSYKGIDLSRSATFNYQGTGTVQWVYALFIILIPYIIYYPMARWVNPMAAAAAIGGLGLISLLMQNFWVEVLTRAFTKRKYLLLAGFREK